MEVKSTQYKTSHTKVHNSVAFSTFIMLYNQHPFLAPKYFVTPKGSPLSIRHSLPIPTSANVFFISGFTFSGYFV